MSLQNQVREINFYIESGDKMRGKVCFEVPENTQEFELEIKPAVVKRKR